MKEPEVSVGIITSPQINFTLHAVYEAKGEEVTERQTAEYDEGGIRWNGNLYQELTFKSADPEATFSLENVTIGVNFHWERTQMQTFRGALKLIILEGAICAINVLPVEEYLKSVISSEMSAEAPIEFLKASAVISRSWLMAQIDKRTRLTHSKENNSFFSFRKTDTELIRWYDREDHIVYDVCADDHCQRYQGVNNLRPSAVTKAVESTHGQVLRYGGKICDARFSKCCGGVTEEFDTCWEDKQKQYLRSICDYIDNEAPIKYDLTVEKDVQKWIKSSPRAFCNTKSKHILSKILNSYDQETSDFYRWTVSYTQEELSALISSKLKSDFGLILDLVPVKRGKSGRLSLLRIVGTKRTLTIGKELEIRRVLSNSHLFSSAFIIDKEYDGEIPSRFILHGAGWGHGVGMCQIGAAVMGERGYTYDQILNHYYQGAEIHTLY